MQSQAKVVGGFKVKRTVTLPLFKISAGKQIFIKSDGPMYLGKELKETEGQQKKQPATLMHVTNLETGELGMIICGTVLKGIFNEDYPGEDYVGRCFAVEMHRAPGKDYNNYTVYEIEVSEAQVAQTKAPPAGPDDGEGDPEPAAKANGRTHRK